METGNWDGHVIKVTWLTRNRFSAVWSPIHDPLNQVLSTCRVLSCQIALLVLFYVVDMDGCKHPVDGTRIPFYSLRKTLNALHSCVIDKENKIMIRHLLFQIRILFQIPWGIYLNLSTLQILDPHLDFTLQLCIKIRFYILILLDFHVKNIIYPH